MKLLSCTLEIKFCVYEHDEFFQSRKGKGSSTDEWTENQMSKSLDCANLSLCLNIGRAVLSVLHPKELGLGLV